MSETTTPGTRAFVIGHPIAHSRSPLIHGHWLDRYALSGSYEPVDVAPADLPGFFDAVRAGAWQGGNVTIPHKEQALALVDKADALATEIGAVNTIVVRNGQLYGSNTDRDGFLANLDQRAPGWDSAKGPAIVLGAGGAARAVIAALIGRGFAPVLVLNRTQSKAQNLAERFGAEAGGLDGFADLAGDARIVVNTIPAAADGALPVAGLERLRAGALVTDIVYVPLMTPILKQADAMGHPTVDGLGMLLHQAVPGFTAWFGRTPEVTGELRDLVIADMAKPATPDRADP